MIIYTVESGDTINSIARQFGVPPLRIAADNGLRNPSQLVIGQSLLIMADSLRYVLQEGQTLYSISQEYGVPLEELIAANPTLNPLNLQAGQTVIIPVGEQPEKRTAVINGYAYPSINTNALNCVLPFLTFISPFSYNITPEADIVPPQDSDLVYRSLRAAVMPLMVVTNLYDGGFSTETLSGILASEELTEKLISGIIDEVRNKNYFGVNMDMEYIAPEDREAYNAMLSDLADRLHDNGYVLTVALAPKTSADQRGLLYESHDYAAQGQIADYIIVMTYEWGYTYGPPLAVSPINEVRRVLDYAVTAIPPEKILMGMPNYGYDWTLPYMRGTPARSVGLNEALELAIRYGSEIMYDEEAQSPYFNYTSESSERHVVWFDDPRSTLAKLKLVEEYNIGGVSWWTVNRCYVPALLISQELFEIQKI